MSLPKINIERINERFGRFGEFLLAHRAILLVAFVVLLAVSVVGMIVGQLLYRGRPDACRNGQVQGNFR